MKKLIFALAMLFCLSFFKTQDTKSILVNLGSNTCGGSTPYVSLIDKTNNNVLINCDVSSVLGNSLTGSLVEYNPTDNFIYLVKINTSGTKIWKFDVGLATGNFVCPTLSTTPTYSYTLTPDMFAINNYGDVYSIGNYNLTNGTATLSKFDFDTGSALSTQTITFPSTDKPTNISAGDITFVSDGKVYAVFGTSPSKLYELTNVGGTGNASATFITSFPNTRPVYALAYVDNQLQISGYSGTNCYTYLYNLNNNTLSSPANFPNSYTPVDHTSIYVSVGSTKNLISKETISPTVADLTYELYLQNTGNVNLKNISLTDNLANVFGAANISNVSVNAVTNPSNLVLNSSFDGITNTELLNTNQLLTNKIPLNFLKLNISLRVSNLNTTTLYANQANVSGYVGTSTNHIEVKDLSNDGPSSSIYPLSTNNQTIYKFDGYCYKSKTSSTDFFPANHGITSLGRAQSDNKQWPGARQSAWTVLESKTKGFVLNRVAFDSTGKPIGIPLANFVEGMLVYDTTNNCLKMFDGTKWGCLNKQTCPPL